MSNAVTRFRMKLTPNVVVSVPWVVNEELSEAQSKAGAKPRKLHEFEFTVQMFAQSELNNAVELAQEAMGRRKAKEPAGPDVTEEEKKNYQLNFNMEYFAQVASFVKRHVTGWKHTPHDGSEKIEFTKGALELLFSEMTKTELQLVGISYLNAVTEEQKKRTSPVSMAPASLPGSSGDSATS